MGRRDAVQVTLELVAEWRRLGAEVTFEPGWERRGNGYGADYEGCVVHHTASPSSPARPFPTQTVLRDGRLGLSGPLCNSAGPDCPVERPRIHVMAAFPANHAGASGGRSMGPLPVTSLFNPKAWGHEIDYAGTVPMSPGQYRAGLIVAKGIANVLGRSIEYVRAHAETSVTGKWDPGYANGRTINMAAFRADAQNLAPPEPEPEEDDMGLIVGVVGGGIWLRDGAGYEHIAEPATVNQLETKAGYKVITISFAEHENWVAQQEARHTAAAAAVVDSKMIAAAVAGAVAKMPAPSLDPAAFAAAFHDEADRRARDNDSATGPVS